MVIYHLNYSLLQISNLYEGSSKERCSGKNKICQNSELVLEGLSFYLLFVQRRTPSILPYVRDSQLVAASTNQTVNDR